MAVVTTEQESMMRHAVSFEGRNYYCATADGEDGREWELLENMGLAYLGRTINDGRNRIYHLTENGKLWLHRAGRKTMIAPCATCGRIRNDGAECSPLCESVRILRNRVENLETANEKIEQLCVDLQATQTGLLDRIVELETQMKTHKHGYVEPPRY